MQLVYNSLRRHSNSRDEELSAGVDDDVDKLVQLALCVILAIPRQSTSC